MVRFQALGGVAVTDHGDEVNVGGPRQRRLLAMLLIHRNAVVSVDGLSDAVFAGEPTPAASTTMRSYVARMRKVVEHDGSEASIVTQAPGYVLRVPDDAFDVARFEAALAEGRTLLSRQDALGAVAVLRDALALWRGEAYAEFGDEDWAQPEVERLAELRLVAHELLFEAELAGGRAAEVIPPLEAVVRQHPMRESFVSQLMVALYRSGRQVEALRAFGRHRDVLVEELGLDPTPTLQALEERILNHDPELHAGAAGEHALRGYRLGERLGTGEDGTLHAAHQPGVERDLVVRVIRPDLADSPAFVRSFEPTALRIASLHHPAIVPVHDYWREPGAAHVVLRRMHGGSLADRIERAGRTPLTRGEVTAIVGRVGAALAAAAEAGLVHGRVRPSNVLFDEGGEAWLTDFDLAPDPGASPATDVAGLAALVRACLPDAGDEVADVLRRACPPGAPPIGPFTADLVAALSGRSPAAPGALPNPYLGLQAFDESDADDFFGRTDLVDHIVDRLSGDGPDHRLVLVVGGSGTGKSSVVRAGLLPRIRRGDAPGSASWFVTTMLPGAAPFKELAAALRRVAVTELPDVAGELATERGLDSVVRRLLPDGAQLLLVVDQFEELFTSAPERDQRRFLDGLVHAVNVPDSRVRVVGTLRADFYDRPLAFHTFGAAVNDATVAIPAMSAAELEAAIVQPAQRCGRHVEGALVAELVGAAVDEPAGLPSLQFTLFELAERTGGDLTLAAYREIGGLSGAIATRAEALYRSLDDDDRAVVRRLFGQLVDVHQEGEPTRRRAARADLIAADPGLDPVIDRWAEARLLSLDRHRHSRLPTVEPAHEALLREWPRLRRWIEQDREALIVLAHLREAADGWVEVDHDAGALYRGARLQVAADVLGSATLGPQERAFLDASLAARDVEEREATARIEEQARANRRLRTQLGVIAVALVVALAGGVGALDQRGEAVDQRRTAFARELTAAADASLDEDPERSMLLALAAIDLTRDGEEALPEAIGALHHAVSRSRIVLSVPDVGGNLDWSPDGRYFVTEGPEDTGVIDVRDAATGESVRSWTGHEIDVNEVAFDHDGKVLATTGDDGRLVLWDAASGEEIRSIDGRGGSWAPSFSPDGTLVAASWFGEDSDVVRIFETSSGKEVASSQRAVVMGTDFDPEGERLAIASIEEPGVGVIDVRSGQVVLRLGSDLDPARDARFSPDGRWIATGHSDGIARIWDARTGEQRFTVAGHTSEVNAVDWSADSSMLATAAQDGIALVHEVTDGGIRELVSVSARDTANGLGAVAFSPDGGRIMTGDWSLASVKVWDISEQAGAELLNAPSLAFAFGSGTFLPDGRTVLAVDDAGDLVEWDVEGERPTRRTDLPPSAESPARIAPSPDGALVAVGLEVVELHDRADGGRVTPITTLRDGYPIAMAWSQDGQHLGISLYNDQGGEILVVDRSGAEAARFEEEPGHWVRTLDFTADGEHIATARGTPRESPNSVGARVWAWRTAEPVLDVAGPANAASTEPDGDRIVFTKVLTDSAEIWDLGSGRRVQTLRGAGAAYGIEWSGDGSQVGMASADGTVRIFDADTGRPTGILRGHERAVSTVSFSADGRRLASLDEAGVVRVWTLDLDELIGIARSRLTRDLDEQECRQYLRQGRCETA